MIKKSEKPFVLLIISWGIEAGCGSEKIYKDLKKWKVAYKKSEYLEDYKRIKERIEKEGKQK